MIKVSSLRKAKYLSQGLREKKTYRVAGKDESQSTAKVVEEDKANGDEDDNTVDAVVSALEKTQITDEQSNLEETDANLVDRAACKVDSHIRT